MLHLRTALITGLAIVVFGSWRQEVRGQAGSVGVGWCPVCGRDVNLATHDFTHGRSSGTRRATPPTRKLNPDNYTVISLYNRTSRNISYSIRSTSGGSWHSSTLAPENGSANWHNADAKIKIHFLVSGVAKYYDLQGNFLYVPGRKPVLGEGVAYHFAETNGGFDLFTGAGTPRELAADVDRQRANDEERRLRTQRQEVTFDSVMRASTRQFHESGLEYWQKGEWRMAIAYFELELRFNPDAADASYYIAEAQKNLQREKDERLARDRAEAENQAKIAEAEKRLQREKDARLAREQATAKATATLERIDGRRVDPITRSLSVQADVGRYGLVHVPAAIMSVRDSGLVNPLDQRAAEADRKLLAPVDVAGLAAMSEADREAILSGRLEAARRNILRNSAGELHGALKVLEVLGVLQPGLPLLEQLKDPEVAAHVAAAARKVSDHELRREQEAVAEIRDIRAMCLLEKEAVVKRPALQMGSLRWSWREISARLGAEEAAEIMTIRDQWRQERDGYLDQLREQGYLGAERTLEEVERLAKWDQAVSVRLQVLQDLAAKRVRDEIKVRDKYTRMITEEQDRVLREKFPASP